MRLIPLLFIAFVTLVECLGILSGHSRIHLFLHRNDVGDGLRALSSHGGSFESFKTNLAIRLKLHGGHLQQFRAVLEAILRRGFGRQRVRDRKRQAKQVL